VVLDVEIEATSATSGHVIVEGTVVAQAGQIDGNDRIEIPLRAGEANFGHLILMGHEFNEEARFTAISIAARASERTTPAR
jgi:hypothetical protein